MQFFRVEEAMGHFKSLRAAGFLGNVQVSGDGLGFFTYITWISVLTNEYPRYDEF